MSGEYARADADRRHRLALLGRVTAAQIADVGLALTMMSGAPYTEVLTDDIFNNGRGHARPPGVARNTLEGTGFASLDIRISRDVTFARGTSQARTLTLGLDTFNVTNHTNYSGFVGTFGAELFGRPVSARSPRQLQLSARFRF